MSLSGCLSFPPLPAVGRQLTKFLSASNALRFSRIHVDSGRINFKRAQEKLPFALVGVTGYVEPEGNGEWRLDLEAAPARAAVILQQAGMLHLSGRVGATSSRLRPATLDFAWTDASLSDVLRLVRATDYGVRGNLAHVLKASTEAQDWNLEGRAEIRQVHRWNLPLRADNPSLNLLAKGILDPELARFDVIEFIPGNSSFECSGHRRDQLESAHYRWPSCSKTCSPEGFRKRHISDDASNRFLSHRCGDLPRLGARISFRYLRRHHRSRTRQVTWKRPTHTPTHCVPRRCGSEITVIMP